MDPDEGDTGPQYLDGERGTLGDLLTTALPLGILGGKITFFLVPLGSDKLSLFLSSLRLKLLTASTPGHELPTGYLIPLHRKVLHSRQLLV